MMIAFGGLVQLRGTTEKYSTRYQQIKAVLSLKMHIGACVCVCV